ncbi:hypothetical protein [Methylobacterium sp. WL120]|uniref:hypothetical protein n=1 Tax=Methylobacterium sp. WL120 TaxID=2603887 RepID=UPI0011CC3D2A|nr:hypothetical protein [Methylobacterium sp. WL120]TXM69615.1 hypothetical protein FV229_04535 [Methylobacterium sp. WL120]
MKTEAEILAWLQEIYVQSQDARQKRMGLSYMTAETHDLARSLSNFLGKSDVERIADMESKVEAIEAALANPIAVHRNMLTGMIAKPNVEDVVHLYGREALCGGDANRRVAVLEIQSARLVEERDTAVDELATLRLDLEEAQLARV